LPGVALRLGNVYGPRQDPHGEAGVVAIFCGRISSGEPPTVFGNGQQTRDYVFVGDVVAAMVATAERLATGAGLTGPYNVGTGTETSVLELAAALADVAGQSSDPEMAPARQGEVQRIAIDPGAAARDLGWSPATRLEQGLRDTYESVAAPAAERIESKRRIVEQ
jgi:UDP-glucose 4-epimerase